MRELSSLFEPIVGVRDVVESFVADHVLVVGWQQTLSEASTRLVELGGAWSDDEVVALGRRVGSLAEGGLDHQEGLTLEVASGVGRLLDEVRVPGLPRPSDDDWGF